MAENTERPRLLELIILADECQPPYLAFEGDLNLTPLEAVHYFPGDGSMSLNFKSDKIFKGILGGEEIDIEPEITETRLAALGSGIIEEYEVETGERVGIEVKQAGEKLPIVAISGYVYPDRKCVQEEYLGLEYTRWRILNS